MRVTRVINFQQFTSNTIATTPTACSTALLTDAQGNKANAALFSTGGSTGAIRWRDDGTAPTSSIGIRLPAGVAPYFYQGDLNRLLFIADSVPGNADVNVVYVQVAD